MIIASCVNCKASSPLQLFSEVCIGVYVHVCVHACVRAYVHVCVHVYLCMPECICAGKQMSNCCPCLVNG